MITLDGTKERGNCNGDKRWKPCGCTHTHTHNLLEKIKRMNI